MKKNRFTTPEEALEAMKKFCAIQDRYQMEVRTKLIEGGIYGDNLENILAELISEQFVDEMRFAKAYVSGKCKINKWGKQKIIQGLKQKDISSYCIDKALLDMDTELYESNLRHLIQSKIRQLPGTLKQPGNRIKVLRFCAGKGYELSLINEILDDLQN
jgi:regulatory protein